MITLLPVSATGKSKKYPGDNSVQMIEWIQDIDRYLFFFFQGLQRPELNWVLAWPTRLGETLIVFALVLSGIFLFDRQAAFRKVPAAALAILGTSRLTEFLKFFFERPRPYLFWEDVAVIFDKPATHAFPSGHTAVIFSGAFILHYYYGKKMRWVYGVAFWVAVTRLYVGVHYPTDLMGGALAGMGCAFLSCRFLTIPPRGSSPINPLENCS